MAVAQMHMTRSAQQSAPANQRYYWSIAKPSLPILISLVMTAIHRLVPNGCPGSICANAKAIAGKSRQVLTTYNAT